MFRRRLAMLLPLVVAASTLAVGGAAGRAAAPPRTRQAAPAAARPAALGDGAIDTRRPVAGPRALAVASADAQASLAHSLGRQGVFELDPRTGTARVVGRLDGTLTGPSTSPAASVAMGWVRRNLTALGLDHRDLRTFHLARDYVDIDGTHHLSWMQSVNGIRAFDNGLLASVTADGRLIDVSGSPAHGLGRTTDGPVIALDAAISRARTAMGANATPRPADTASLVYFHGARSTLAYQTLTTTTAAVVSVIDATTGAVLWRSTLSRDATGTGSAWGYFPSSSVPNGGGVQQPVTFPVNELLAAARQQRARVHRRRCRTSRPTPAMKSRRRRGLDWTTTADTRYDPTTSQNCRADARVHVGYSRSQGRGGRTGKPAPCRPTTS